MTAVVGCRRSLLVVALVVGGCGGGSTDERDASAEDAALADAAVSVEDADVMADVSVDALVAVEPMPPEPPVLTPCAAGWTAVTDAEGTTTCEPWPASFTGCTGSAVRLPGDPACGEIGDVCPAGDYASGLPATQVLFVRAGASGGNGTMASPFGTVTRALNGATAGTTIAVSKGTYDEALVMKAGVTIVGACASLTVLAPSRAATAAVVVADEAASGLRNVTIRGARPGITVGATGSLEVRGVLVDATLVRGVAVVGGRLTGSRLAIRGITAAAEDSIALHVTAGGSAVLDGGLIANLEQYGLWVDGATSQAALGGFAIGGRIALPVFPLPVVASQQASVALARSVVEDSPAGLAYGSGSRLSVVDSIIRDTGDARWDDPGVPGRLLLGGAIHGTGGVSVSLSRVTIERARGYGLKSLNTGLDISDVVIREAVGVRASGSVRARRVLLRDQENAAVHLAGVAGFELADIFVDRGAGIGLQLDRSTGVLARVRVRQAGAIAFGVDGPATVVSTDLVLEDTRDARCTSWLCEPFIGLHYGLAVYDGANVDIRRFRLSSHEVGAIVAENGAVDLHEGFVIDNGTGANLQSPTYDVRRLLDRVVYRRNQANIDSATLPLPPLPTPTR